MGSAAHAQLGLSRGRGGSACSEARGKGLQMCSCGHVCKWDTGKRGSSHLVAPSSGAEKG